MHAQLLSRLESYRKSRRFDAEQYTKAKAELLNSYFRQCGINGCVVGVSGGVDSAVTLGLMAFAARQPDSPIRHVQGVLLPMHAEGATNQDTASSRGAEATAAFGASSITIDLSSTLAAARKANLDATGVQGSPWAAGQLVSLLRTPMLYYQTALLLDQGVPSVVCGTTNRDEGSYIGFFGKGSDGMVDIQVISDAHKSEVYQLAEYLHVPKSVRDATPTGDTYDGACDEEMIGTPYDFIELYTWFLHAGRDAQETWKASLCPEALEQFQSWAERLEKRHQVNHHKYIGDSPAVHLDLYERAVPGGWRSQDIELRVEEPSRQTALKARVGPVELGSRAKELLRRPNASLPPGEAAVVPLGDFGESAKLVRHVLSAEVCDEMMKEADSWGWVPADLHGRPIVAKENNEIVGSQRATAYDEEVAQLLWAGLVEAGGVPNKVRVMGEKTPTDWGHHRVWRAVGINPMLRFIRYHNGGALVPHYDAGFDFNDNAHHTLQSVVFTLTPSSGTSTRLLLDPQRALPLDERNFTDWTRPAGERDILVRVPAEQGDALIFDHRVLHDAPVWHKSSLRILLRTDIVYQRCAPNALARQPNLTRTPPPLPAAKWTRDPTFRKAYEILGSVEEIEDAGYFDDGLDGIPRTDPKWWTAPFDKILNRLAHPAAQSGQELVVLVSTGAFCPVHAGHLEMMEQARRELESRGKVVLGGYLAPDHDDYVSSKCGPETLSAPRRLDLCERAVRDSSWLMVEHWGASHVSTAVNFTAIVDRISETLAYNVRTQRPIEVVFVFGSDNARFAKAFVGRGSCVCVLRPGSEAALDDIAKHPAVICNPRIVFSRSPTPPIASRVIRQGDATGVPGSIKQEWSRICAARREVGEEESTGDMNLYLRREGEWAVQLWKSIPGLDYPRLCRAYEVFCDGLTALLQETYARASTLEGGPDVHIIPLHLPDQAKTFRETFATTNSSVISLDPCLPGVFNLEISRCFHPLSDAEPTFVPRPGADPLDVQLTRIPHSSYILFDDDTFSGRTAVYAQQLLSARCTIERFATLCDTNGPLNDDHHHHHESRRPRLNQLDSRDFLVGARDAGMVVRLLDGSVGRAPYVLPYVRPHYHASIPVSEEMSFSRAVWELNRRFFASLGSSLRLADMSLAYREMCGSRGFDMGMGMVEHCEWHLERRS